MTAVHHIPGGPVDCQANRSLPGPLGGLDTPVGALFLNGMILNSNLLLLSLSITILLLNTYAIYYHFFFWMRLVHSPYSCPRLLAALSCLSSLKQSLYCLDLFRFAPVIFFFFFLPCYSLLPWSLSTNCAFIHSSQSSLQFVPFCLFTFFFIVIFDFAFFVCFFFFLFSF